MAEWDRYLREVESGIVTLDPLEAMALHKQGEACFVDLRDGFELGEHGMIEGAKHCPRGSLEFRIPVSNRFHEPFFALDTRFVFYCSHGERSILSTRTALDLGLQDVCHIGGGLRAWVAAGGGVVAVNRRVGS